MNIMFFIPNVNGRGGVERATINLVNSLVNVNSVTVKLLTFSKPNGDGFPIDDNISVHSLEVDSFKKQYFRVLRQVFFSVRDSVDIFVVVETMSLCFCFLPFFFKRSHVKYVVWEHFNFRNNNGRKLRHLLRLVAARASDLIVVLTKRDAEEWRRHMNLKADIVSIPNINSFSKMICQYQAESRTVLSVGRYTKVKGFDRLLKIWGVLQRKYNCRHWNLEIVGYGEESDNLKAQIFNEELENVSLLKYEDVSEAYRKASIYCMASYSEGLPMVLIEAQSFGLPAVAFDIYTGPSEVLDYDSGFLVPDHDLDAYAEAVHRLMIDADLRINMSRRASVRGKGFSEEVIADQWVSTLMNADISPSQDRIK